MNNDQVSTGAFLVIGVVICLEALSYKLGRLSSPGSGFMPFLAGAAIIVCSAFGFIYATARRTRGERWSRLMKGVRWQRAFVMMGALSAYALLLMPLGFVLCTFLFMGFMLRAIVPMRWPVVVGGALVAALLSYAVFDLWLKAQLPRGRWGF